MVPLYRLISIVLFFSFSYLSNGQLSTPPIFNSGMVLQRYEPLPVWGSAAPLEPVDLSFRSETFSTVADGEGNWIIEMPASTAGGPFQMTITSGNESITYDNVYVGEVWLASGQSNMAWLLSNSDPPDSTIDSSNNPEIRQFSVNKSLKAEPSVDFPAGSKWIPTSIDYADNLSAVGYYFAKYMYEYLDVPIGIINNSFGGTRIEAWMSEEVLGFDEKDIVLGDGKQWLQPTLAYNAMLKPLKDFPFRGIIWYQGESNAGSREDAVEYRYLFDKMITSWRDFFGTPDMPFLWVQLPNYGNPASENSPGTWDTWPLIRESQSAALELPHTGEATAIDLGGGTDIHPTNKQPVGQRLSFLARSLVYNDTIIYSGPRYKEHQLFPDGRIEINFRHTENQLINTSNDSHIRWFSIVKKDGNIVKAEAEISGEKVIVWNDNVADPYAVRYAWETNPNGVNLYNSAGLPAAPFYIYADTTEKQIVTYTASSTKIYRDESTFMRWEVRGNVYVKFNNSTVEKRGARRIWPVSDSLFKLEMFDVLTGELLSSKSIEIEVIQPIPTVSIFCNYPEIVPVDTIIEITSEVSLQNGAPVDRVDFMLNGEIITSDFTTPYSLSLSHDSAGTFNIHAKVYNTEGENSESNILTQNVTELDFINYEAENANYTWEGILKNSPSASNGQYLELLGDWEVVFDSIESTTTAEHLCYIRYRLNNGSPRLQQISINDSTAEDILFSAESTDIWYDYITTIPLDSGMNAFAVLSKWGYMSLDAVKIGFTKVSSIPEDTTGINTLTQAVYSNPKILLKVYPNPAMNNTTLEFTVAREGVGKIKIFDMNNRVIRVINDAVFNRGKNTFFIETTDFPNGIFIIRIQLNDKEYYTKLYKLR